MLILLIVLLIFGVFILPAVLAGAGVVAAIAVSVGKSGLSTNAKAAILGSMVLSPVILFFLIYFSL